MKRVIKITMICPMDIDDNIDISDESELNSALMEAVGDDLFSTDYLSNWDELSIEDMGEWEI